MIICGRCHVSPCECVYCHDCGEPLVGGCEPYKIDSETGEIVEYGQCIVLGEQDRFPDYRGLYDMQ